MNIKTIQTSRVLSATSMTVAQYAINPYRGCEFGCHYCYAQYSDIARREPQTLGIKINAPDILEKELKTKTVKNVVLGSNCECFSYQEPTYRITEKILHILRDHRIPATILTKSPLIADHLDILRETPGNRVFFTYNFSCEVPKHLLEDFSPPLVKRLGAMRLIGKKGIPLRSHIGPFIPFISDLKDIFKKIKGITNTVNIELYHNKLGNFDVILERVKQWDKTVAEKLIDIYSSVDTYTYFTRQLKEQIQELNRPYGYTIYYIVPEYDTHYTTTIDYEQALL